jgi:hypothetical protein
MQARKLSIRSLLESSTSWSRASCRIRAKLKVREISACKSKKVSRQIAPIFTCNKRINSSDSWQIGPNVPACCTNRKCILTSPVCQKYDLISHSLQPECIGIPSIRPVQSTPVSPGHTVWYLLLRVWLVEVNSPLHIKLRGRELPD